MFKKVADTSSLKKIMTEEETKIAAGKTAAESAEAQIKTEGENDYKAELDRVKKQLGQAEHTIITLKKKKDEGDESVTNIDSLMDELREENKKALQQAKNEMIGDTLQEELLRMSSDESERELIKLRYENSINKSGTSRAAILADLQDARILANKPRFDKLMSEASRSANTTPPSSSGGTSSVTTGSDTIELSKEEENAVQKMAQRTGKPVEEIRRKLMANKQL